MATKRLMTLTPEHYARLPEWRDRWIAIGLSTERMDLDTFSRGARAAYGYAGLAEPRVIVPVSSPLVLALAAPVAARILGGGAVSGAVSGAVGGAVGDAVGGAWYRYIGGQFWVGGWWWLGSPSVASCFREVVALNLPGDTWDRARAYEATATSACWWWPHREFVMVSDRPVAIHRDDQGRLHCKDGPAIVWPDGWGVHSWHGVRVPAEVIETPADQIDHARITAEANVEIRRVLIERMGATRYLAAAGATRVAVDDWGALWRAERPGDSPIVVVDLLNSTPEPDGSTHVYHVRVPGTTEQPPRHCHVCDANIAIVPRTPREAIGWGYGVCAEHYAPVAMS